jgi:hypothetical protein
MYTHIVTILHRDSSMPIMEAKLRFFRHNPVRCHFATGNERNQTLETVFDSIEQRLTTPLVSQKYCIFQFCKILLRTTKITNSLCADDEFIGRYPKHRRSNNFSATRQRCFGQQIFNKFRYIRATLFLQISRIDRNFSTRPSRSTFRTRIGKICRRRTCHCGLQCNNQSRISSESLYRKYAIDSS